MKAPAAFAALATLALALVSTGAPAFARDSYVFDDAQLLSQNAISQINAKVGAFNAATGKEVVVVTTTSLAGVAPGDAAERAFAQRQVNGVEIFIAKNDRQTKILGDHASRQFFPAGSFDQIAQAMAPSFKAGNFDVGVETGVGLILNTYRGHESSLNRGRVHQPVSTYSGGSQRTTSASTGGSGLGFIWWIIILAVIFFIIRGIFRAMSGPRMYGGGMGGPGMGGPGYGPGYGGGGYGYGGGGGGFWSGLLGGLGGAWLGNEMFGNRNNINVGDGSGSYAGTGGDAGNSADASGWQSDAGQADTSNMGGGGWGDSGGGFGGGDSGGGGWGGGDSGGGGGGDSGGGGW